MERWRMVANKSGNGKFENNNMRRLMHIGADMTGLNEWMNAVVSEDLKKYGFRATYPDRQLTGLLIF